MVGDLLELEPHKGPLWFWLSFVRVVISLAWRRSLAFIVAPYAGLWILGKLVLAVQNSYLRHAPSGTWGAGKPQLTSLSRCLFLDDAPVYGDSLRCK
jgi:hypothetical protein